MSVTFLTVTFQNNTGIQIPLTIEAPFANIVYGPGYINGNTTVIIPIGQRNCSSVRLLVTDQDHGAVQDFVVGPPQMGRPSYIETVNAVFPSPCAQ